MATRWLSRGRKGSIRSAGMASRVSPAVPDPDMTLIIAELWRDGKCIARWTDEDGPPGLAAMLPRLRAGGWTIHDFRDAR